MLISNAEKTTVQLELKIMGIRGKSYTDQTRCTMKEGELKQVGPICNICMYLGKLYAYVPRVERSKYQQK